MNEALVVELGIFFAIQTGALIANIASNNSVLKNHERRITKTETATEKNSTAISYLKAKEGINL